MSSAGSDSLTSSSLSKPRGAGLTLGGATGAGIGTALLRPVSGYVGDAVGAALGEAVQAAREAGIQTTDHLVSQDLLNPALMRVLLSKATPQNQVSLVSAVQPRISRDQQQQQQRRAAAPAFAVRRNDLAPLAPRAASYGGQPVNSLVR